MGNVKKILITGASGFIGTNLINKLLRQGFNIAVLNRSSNLKLDTVKQYAGDISDYDFVEKSVLDFQPNKVFHLAGYKERSSKVEDLSISLTVNLLGTLNLYQALLKITSVESIVTLGTTDEYGGNEPPFKEILKELPASAYGFSKFCATKLSEFFSRNFKLPIVVLRPTIAYGPHQGLEMFIPSLINSLISGEKYEMTPGDQVRDFIYISDLIDVMLTVSVGDGFAGQVFNVGSGEAVKIKEVAIYIAKHLDKEHLLHVGAMPYRDREVMHYMTSIDEICNKSGWKPKVNFEKGLGLTVEYFKNNEE